jgi:hypothetical protein
MAIGHWIGKKLCETKINRQRALTIATKEKIPLHHELVIANNEADFKDQAEPTKVTEMKAEIKDIKDRMAAMERIQRNCNTTIRGVRKKGGKAGTATRSPQTRRGSRGHPTRTKCNQIEHG